MSLVVLVAMLTENHVNIAGSRAEKWGDRFLTRLLDAAVPATLMDISGVK
jgi:hypothetical protein